LNSKEYKDINVINSAKIIDDLIHFTMARKFNISMFWELTNYLLSQETDYVTWYPMIKMIEYVSKVIPFTSTTHIVNSTHSAHSKHPISFTITVKKFYLLKNTN